MRNGAEILLPQGITGLGLDFAARPNPETESRQVVYYAGESPKRASLLRMLVEAEGKVFDSTPGGPENNSLDPIQIATGKINHAVAFLIANQRIKPNSPTENVFVAADVQIHYPILKPDGKTVSRTSGKLKRPSDVRHLFQGMIDSAKTTGDKRNYGYLIQRGSEARAIMGAQAIKMKPDPGEPDFFFIALEQEAVDFFATPEGTSQYLDELNKLLRSPQYLSNGVEHSGSVTEICGGLDLTVLKRRKAIRKINRTKKESADFESMLESALFAAHFGFHMSVLEQVFPNASELAKQYPWFKGIVEYTHGAVT